MSINDLIAGKKEKRVRIVKDDEEEEENKKKKNPRSQGWCFTINNYTLMDEVHVHDLRDVWKAIYLICGKEEGKKEKTPHLQGYVYFDKNHPKTFEQMKLYLGDKAHIEKAQGSPQDNRKYCSKDGNFYEEGQCPRKGRRSDLDAVTEDIIENKKLEHEIAKDHPKVYIQYGRGIRDLINTIRMPELERKERRNCFWLYGDPGAGKTREALRMANEATGNNPFQIYKWGSSNGGFFNGYKGQDVAILDDFRAGDIKFGILMNIADPWHDCQVEIKQSYGWWTSKIVIVTSVKSPYEEFGKVAEDMRQIERRFEIKRIGETHMNDLNLIPESPIPLSELL